MKELSTCFSNYKIVVDDCNIPVAVTTQGKVEFQLYDMVKVTADIKGYIGSGITREGFGQIIQIQKDSTDYFYGVLTRNQEFGFVKASRLQLLERRDDIKLEILS